MAQTTLSIRIDEKLKKDFDALCEDFGMNISTAITIFAKKVVAERKIPFEVAANDNGFYSETNQIYLRKAIEEIKRGDVVIKTMEELEAMEEDE